MKKFMLTLMVVILLLVGGSAIVASTSWGKAWVSRLILQKARESGLATDASQVSIEFQLLPLLWGEVRIEAIDIPELKLTGQGKFVRKKIFFEGKIDGNSVVFRGKITSSGGLKGRVEAEIHSVGASTAQGTVSAEVEISAEKICTLQAATVKTDLFCFKGSAIVDLEQKKIVSAEGTFLFPHLSHLATGLQGTLEGSGSYTEKAWNIEGHSDEIHVGPLLYTDVSITAEGDRDHDVWDTSILAAAAHPTLPLSLRARGTYAPSAHMAHLEKFDVRSGPTALALEGDIDLTQWTGSLALFFHSLDLARLSPLTKIPLQGQIGGNARLEGDVLTFSVVARHLRCGDLLVEQGLLEGVARSSRELSVTLSATTAYIPGCLFERLDATLGWDGTSIPFAFKTHGAFRGPASLAAEGRLYPETTGGRLDLSTLAGSLLGKPILLHRPVQLAMTDKLWLIQDLDLKVGDGQITTDVRVDASGVAARSVGHHVPIDIATLATNRFSLEGTTSWEFSLQGETDHLQGHGGIVLEESHLMQPGWPTPLEGKGVVQLHLDRETLQVHAELNSSKGQFFEAFATLPCVLSPLPWHVSFPEERPLAAKCVIEGEIEELFDFVNFGSHRLRGLASGQIVVSGSLASPVVQGIADLQSGVYDNYSTGMALRNIDASMRGEKSRLYVTSCTADDGDGGDLEGRGMLDLRPPFPFAFDTVIDQLAILRLDWLTAKFSGPVTITGDATTAIAQGDVTVDTADLTVPDRLPLDPPVLPVVYENFPEHLTPPPPAVQYPFLYKANLHAPKGIFLSGRGLLSELAGDLAISGQNLTATIQGSLHLLKGKFGFGGQEFALTKGEISFSPIPYLNLTGTLSLSDLTITAHLKGPLANPTLSFQSSPALPTSSIIAKILFNKDVSELSAPQAVQLADTIVTLSGGTGPGVLETIRKTLGVDRLNIVSSNENPDQISVQIGKYLMDGVMITLAQSTQSSQIIVEIELKGGIVLRAETQEDEQGKFSVKWNKNY